MQFISTYLKREVTSSVTSLLKSSRMSLCSLTVIYPMLSNMVVRLLKPLLLVYTNWQRFVTREEAMIIAREQGQLFRPDGTHNPDVLYSECLY